MSNAGWRLLLQAALAGGLQALALSTLCSYTGYAAGSGWLSIVSLLWLAVLVGKAKLVRQAVWAGWMYACVWLTGSVWWLYISMHEYGGMPSIMAAFAVLLLCVGLGLIYGLAVALVRKVSASGQINVFAFVLAWLLAELTRGYIFTGFPWAAIGYAQVDSLLSAYMPWIGVYGVSAVVAFVAACAATVIFLNGTKTKRQLLWLMACIVFVFGACFALDRDFTQPVGEMRVALLQGNVPQDLKFQREVVERSLNWYIEAMVEAKAQGAQLVVVPETAIAVFPQNIAPNTWAYLQSNFLTGQTAALIGIPLSSPEKGYTNSMLGFAPGQPLYVYDKHHLVPFGEFVPWGFRWFVNIMDIPLGDFGRGPVDAASFMWQDQRIAPHICYEDLFGEELARRFAIDADSPTLMVNASNIAWFGDTVAVPQHLQIARARALEFQRPMVRATNTGATAIISHQGQVLEMLEPYTQGVLIGTVEGRQGRTPYAYWAGVWGLWPLWLLSIGWLAFFLWRARPVK